jgi:poly-gamma-glutamate synthesis protein (capsule biosynthesis protein)
MMALGAACWRMVALAVTIGAAGLAATGCTEETPEQQATPSTTDSGAGTDSSPPVEHGSVVQLLFAGDVMLGRGVAVIAAADPDGLLAGIRPEVRSADLAVANLESPLTARPHDPSFGPNALEADPGSAELLADAGFDAMAIANNHAGDAGPATVSDTMDALAAAGLDALGAGSSVAEAFRPRIVSPGGLRVALLAFDATGQGPRAKAGAPGVAWWDEGRVQQAVEEAKAAADVVAVGLHGGAEYVPVTDPYLMRLGQLLASWGVDIVWCTGPHVAQPVHVIDPDGDGRPTIVATSLGNLIFDQHIPGTRVGKMLDVLAGRDGVRTFRVGQTDHTDGPVQFLGWEPPGKSAVALDGAWWTVASVPPVHPVGQATTPEVFEGDVVSAALGDPDGDGREDLVVAFRRPFAQTVVNARIPRRELVDEEGRSAHLGLYRPGDLRPRWVAGTLLRPVADVAPCDGSLAVAYSTLDDQAIVGTGAWRWGGFGFVALPDLPGPGVPACADLDGDGKLDPLVLERSTR